MWRLWKVAKTYRTRPSDLLGVDDKLAAYHFDVAVWTFGTELDEAIRQATEPQKQGRKTKALSPSQIYTKTMGVLEKWLGVEGLKKFRDPATGLGKR